MDRMLCASLLLCSVIAYASANVNIPTDRVVYNAIGSSSSVMCTTDSDRDPNDDFHWVDESGNRIPTSTESSCQGSCITTTTMQKRIHLQFTEFQEDQKGLYTCKIKVLGGNEYSEASVQVNAKVVLEITSPSEQRPFVNTDAEIKCETNAESSTTVNWQMKAADGRWKTISTEGRFTAEGSLKIDAITEADNGIYRCTVFPDNPVTNEGSPSLDIKVIVYVPPEITEWPRNGKSGRRHDDLDIECKATGTPTPTIYWTKNGETSRLGELCPPSSTDICDSTGHFVKTDMGDGLSKLTINRLETGDTSEYVCNAISSAGKNDKGQDIMEADQQIFQLTVIDPPEILDMINKTDDAGKSTDLICRVTGTKSSMKLSFTKISPNSPSMAPYVLGQQPSDPRIEVLELNDEPDNSAIQLKISGLTKDDKANYSCTATNDAGEMIRNGSITVNYKPEVVVAKSDVKVFNWNENRQNITCWFDAEPVPSTIVWYKEGVVVGEILKDNKDDNIQVKVRQQNTLNSTLEVYGKVESDTAVYGRYMCNATNLLGSAAHYVDMIKAVEPAKPKVTVQSIGPRTVVFNITPEVEENNLPVVEINIEWMKGGQEKSKTFGLDEEKRLDNLEPAFDYKFSVSGRSRAFQKGKVEVVPVKTLDVQTTPKFETTVVTVQTTAEAVVQTTAEAVVQTTAEAVIQTTAEAVVQTTAEAFVHTLPKKKPDVVKITSQKDSTLSNGYVLSWELPSDGGAKVTSFTIKYREVGTDKWKTKQDKGTHIDSTLTNLKPNTEYEVMITATNSEGESDAQPQAFKFKTLKAPLPKPDPTTSDKNATTKATITGEVVGKGGLSTAVIIVIVIILFIIILIIIDVTCYFRQQCGLLMCICVNCCGKKPPATESTEKDQLKMEEGQGEGDASEPAEEQVLTVSENPDAAADDEKKEALPEDDETAPLNKQDEEKKDPEKDEDSKAADPLIDDEDKKEPMKDEDEDLKKVEVEVKDGGDAPADGKTTSTPTAL